jgi:hypothetical protein
MIYLWYNGVMMSDQYTPSTPNDKELFLNAWARRIKTAFGVFLGDFISP